MTPLQLVNAADELNLKVIALTDHDTMEGIAAAQKAARNYALEVMPGIEITTDFNGRECHMLAYNFDLSDEGLKELLRHNKNARIERAKWIIGELGKKGLKLDIQEILAEAGGKNVGRPHIAAILLKKGYIASKREAFIRYLSDEALGPIESNYKPVQQAIENVKKAGGVAILAHPGRLYSQQELALLVAAGIDGLEMIHPSHNYELQKEMEVFAEQNHLLTTGGSDFHGAKKSYYRHFGILTISDQHVDKIKNLSAHRKKVSA